MALALSLLTASALYCQSVNTPTPCNTCKHHTKWWVSTILVLVASSAYAASNRTIDEGESEGNGLKGPAGLVVAKQLGLKFGITGVMVTGEWFLLKYQGGAKHRRLEPALTILNYAGAATLSGLAASTLKDRQQAAQTAHPVGYAALTQRFR